jgi:hypothetical protein
VLRFCGNFTCSRSEDPYSIYKDAKNNLISGASKPKRLVKVIGESGTVRLPIMQ